MAAVEWVEQAAFDADVPVLIVGGGAGGLVAGLAAHDAGGTPLVLERDALPRGSTAMSSGFIPACNTRFQRERGVLDDTVEQMAGDIRRKNHDRSDVAVVNALASHSAATLEWLHDHHGVAFELVDGFLYPGHSCLRMHATPGRSGEELMGYLQTAAESAGVDVVTDARVTTLYVETGTRRVLGVGLERPDGEREAIGCRMLVLACNGYGGNPELVARYLDGMTEATYYGHAGNQGDAVLWGEAIGAQLLDLGAFQGHGSLAVPQLMLVSWSLMMQGGVQVNRLGQRFSNENLGYSEQARKVLAQPGGRVWNVFDQRIHAFAEAGFPDYRAARDAGALRQADSVEALAALIGVPVDALVETFTTLRHSAETGMPDAFGRRFDAEQLLRPTYCAMQVTGALFHTQGGLAIDTRGRVLDTAAQPLPNLYAVGGAARGVSGAADDGYLSGNGLLAATVMGAIAGRDAARRIGEEDRG